MKFSIPYTTKLINILNELNDYELNQISEIYFSDKLHSARFIFLNDHERNELKEIKDKFNIRLNYLFNPHHFDINFYLEENFNKFFNILKEDYEFYKFKTLTLTNTFLMNLPILRNFLNDNNIDLKVSVNNQIDSLKKLQIYFCELSVNNIVLDRSINRNEEELEKCYKFAKDNNIKLTLMLNEGCMPNCQYKQFCDQMISQYYKQDEKEVNILSNIYNALGCHTNFQIIPEKGLQQPFIAPIQLDYFNKKYNNYFEYKIVGRNKPLANYKEMLYAYMYMKNTRLYEIFSVEKHQNFRKIYSDDLLEFDFFNKVKNCKLECYNCPHKSNNKSFCKIVYENLTKEF